MKKKVDGSFLPKKCSSSVQKMGKQVTISASLSVIGLAFSVVVGCPQTKVAMAN